MFFWTLVSLGIIWVVAVAIRKQRRGAPRKPDRGDGTGFVPYTDFGGGDLSIGSDQHHGAHYGLGDHGSIDGGGSHGGGGDGGAGCDGGGGGGGDCG